VTFDPPRKIKMDPSVRWDDVAIYCGTDLIQNLE